MAIQTFEYCSLYYLNQWLSYDQSYCQALSENNKEKKLIALKRAGGFYGVSRNVPKECDKDNGMARYQPILEILDGVYQNQFQNNPVDRIYEIRNKISKKYKNRNLLSLTTKFLWLKVKQPILIYDSQARKALSTEDGDLDTYYKKWKESFHLYQDRVKQVCSKLSALSLYSVNTALGTKEYIKEVSSKSWFHERIFDIYLWNKGNDV
ncbi:hypothetical protein ACFLZV_04135 [Candidatus Margulisiibacteriota bacterium]